jgi:hypothetical protein
MLMSPTSVYFLSVMPFVSLVLQFHVLFFAFRSPARIVVLEIPKILASSGVL